MWRQYVDLGLTALPFAEEHGGVGGGPVETMIVMEAFGRALALEPYLATVVLGGGFLRRGASDAVKSDVLPKVAAGEALLAFAHTERQSRYDLADVATTAKKDGAGYVLDGEKSLAVHGDVADKLIVSARVSGEQRATERHRTVPRRCQSAAACRGAAIRPWTACAPPKSRCRTSRSAPTPLIGEPGNAYPLIEQVVDSGIAALARRGGRRDGRDARDHGRLPEAAQAVRRADRQLPGAAAPRRRHADRARTGALDGDACHHDGGRGERRRAAQGDFRRQGADRPLGQDRRRRRDPAPWRHRHDHGVQGRPLLQARHHDRQDRSATPTITSPCLPA